MKRLLFVLGITLAACSDSEVTSVHGPHSVNVFPNPCSGEFRCFARNDGTTTDLLKVFNSKGGILQEHTLPPNSDFSLTVNVMNAPGNVFKISLETDQGTIVKQVIKLSR
jgi:hypothetical protein